MIKNDNLNKYNTIWDKISSDIKIELNSNLFTIKNNLKTKTKPYGGEATDSYKKEVPKVDYVYTCLALIFLDSILKMDKNYCYPQFYLEECKYIECKVN